MWYKKISATNNKRETSHSGKIKWLITVRTAGSIQARRTHCQVRHHEPISQLGRVHSRMWAISPQYIYVYFWECKWGSAVHINSITSCMHEILKDQGGLQKFTLVLLRKAGHKWIVCLKIYFSISRAHHSVLSIWLKHSTLSEVEALKYCPRYFRILG